MQHQDEDDERHQQEDDEDEHEVEDPHEELEDKVVVSPRRTTRHGTQGFAARAASESPRGDRALTDTFSGTTMPRTSH